MANLDTTQATSQMRARHHVARAKKVLDTLRQVQEFRGNTLPTSLLVISNELAEALDVLNSREA